MHSKCCQILSNLSNTSLRQLREETIYNCVTLRICRPESCLSYQRALVPSASGIFQINKATILPRLQIYFLLMRVFSPKSDSFPQVEFMLFECLQDVLGGRTGFFLAVRLSIYPDQHDLMPL